MQEVEIGGWEFEDSPGGKLERPYLMNKLSMVVCTQLGPGEKHKTLCEE
jgi:hypothetical protein